MAVRRFDRSLDEASGAHAAETLVMLPLRRDEVARFRRLLQKLVHLRLDQFVGLRLSRPAVLEFEQRMDE
jgi:hypothetical protein